MDDEGIDSSSSDQLSDDDNCDGNNDDNDEDGDVEEEREGGGEDGDDDDDDDGDGDDDNDDDDEDDGDDNDSDDDDDDDEGKGNQEKFFLDDEYGNLSQWEDTFFKNRMKTQQVKIQTSTNLHAQHLPRRRLKPKSSPLNRQDSERMTPREVKQKRPKEKLRSKKKLRPKSANARSRAPRIPLALRPVPKHKERPSTSSTSRRRYRGRHIDVLLPRSMSASSSRSKLLPNTTNTLATFTPPYNRIQGLRRLGGGGLLSNSKGSGGTFSPPRRLGHYRCIPSNTLLMKAMAIRRRVENKKANTRRKEEAKGLHDSRTAESLCVILQKY